MISLLNDCEEFFDLIANEEENVELDRAMDSLRVLLEEQEDGWTNFSDERLAYAVQSRLEEIWNLITKEEKRQNQFLEDHYSILLEQLQEISGYEADAIEGE